MEVQNTIAWESLNHQELLQMRIKDLGLSIEKSSLNTIVQKLYAELDAHGLLFHPQCYLGDEWFCPDRVPLISIPFYLSHPTLTQLEIKMMLECEGSDDDDCLRLLRHECGHALNYAFTLWRRKKWKEVFGDFNLPYEDTYKPKPFSKQFVRHLDDWYAQYHPDEDFAETFAVWLDPESDWREAYKSWGAIKKLEYVDQLMKDLKGVAPKVTGGKKICDAKYMTSKLKTYYDRKQKRCAYDLPGFYDQDLKRIFSSGHKESELAVRFLRKNRKQIVSSVSNWTGESSFMISRLLHGLEKRCKELTLLASPKYDQQITEVVSYLTVLTMNYRMTGKFEKKL
ncbi:MAG: hypothetical protein COV43_07550 [Deltaproteobacteria bacterium CG11_big_fil_rev_8_21_14_0_20_42_23]|nr:MAG: hypothetical protein COV43_07550 [Deltaproteobacteria bacterium CG11_big_fil_rev_8_21_14_0_20_42_23]PJC63317.1 MAG: hypothetical protein CO021_09915 [Deltaproteobacteria bacterium CG_4_9_14_0_2_um_filter_42_21]